MAYTAPDFQDRVAIGDNKYIMTDAGDGKILLTPTPDEVTVAGTDINKAIMQPLADTVEKLDKQIIPYIQYYWLVRGISGYYSETQDLAWKHGDCYRSHSSSSPTKRTMRVMWFFLYTESSDSTKITIRYADKINISQTNGAVTLASPRTITFTDSDSYTTIQNTLGDKYITGIGPNVDQIFYIPADNSIQREKWYTSGDFSSYSDYVGYMWNIYDNDSVDEGSGTRVMYISSKYNSTNTGWSVVSSLNPDTYPTSGTVDGTEYIKLGRIDETILNYAVNNPSAFKDLVASYEARISALEAAIAGI